MAVAFMHVPKSAGTSYTAFLAAALPGEHLVERIHEADGMDHLRSLEPDQLRRYSLIAGHFDHGLCRRAPFLRPVSLLREPVDRLVSWYHHVCRSERADDRPWREVIEGRGMTVEDFVTNPTVQRVHGQVMAEQLAGYGFGDPVPTDPEVILKDALAHLDALTHLALFEDLEASRALAEVELELDTIPPMPRQNLGSGPDPLSTEVRLQVAPHLALDHPLYEHAVTEFHRRLRAHGLAPSTPTLEISEPAGAGGTPTTTPSAPTSAPAKGERVRRSRRSSVGDWIEVGWQAEERTPLGALLAGRPSAATLPLVRTVAGHGSSHQLDPIDESVLVDPTRPDGWLRTSAGVHQVSVSVTCSPSRPQSDPWVLLLALMWCIDPPLPGARGIPGNPDLERWMHQLVPPQLPVRPRRGTPLSASTLISVPRDRGHLYVAMGTSVPVVAVAGDEVRLTVARVG